MVCMIIINTDVSMLEDVSISVDTQISVTIMDEQRICPICDKVISRPDLCDVSGLCTPEDTMRVSSIPHTSL